MNIRTHIKKIENLVPGKLSEAEQVLVFNTLETVLQTLSEQQKINQALKDEINHLKGEQGKADIRGKNQKEKEGKGAEEKQEQPHEQTALSSEDERKEPKKRRKKRVKFDGSQRVDDEKVLDIEDKSGLPSDIEFKGYATSYYQTLEIRGKLIEVKRATYYSPGTGKTYTAPLPANYEQGHDFTQALKAHVGMLRFEFGMTIPKIGDLLRMNGVDISNGTLSNMLLATGESLTPEAEAIHQTGTQMGLYNQTDTTGSRVNGENYHTHIFGNDYYTAYFTRAHKDRQTVLDLLRSEQPRIYVLNEDTLAIYDYLKIPKKVQNCLNPLLGQTILAQADFIRQLKEVLAEEAYQRHQDKLLEGAYLAAYQTGDWLLALVVDDAPQYKLLAVLLVLCWVHIGRHFKKLHPKIKHHQELLGDFLTDFWQFYHRLKDYKQAPEPLLAKQLSRAFDQLFSRKTGFELLDERIAKTKAKKNELLVVLKHPYVPLHNNESELAARKEVRYRDISFQTRNLKGTQAKDTFFTILQTCKKLGVNAYAYILDRVTKKLQMMLLTHVMVQKAMV